MSKEALKQEANTIANIPLDISIPIINSTLWDKIRKRQERIFKVNQACLDTLVLVSKKLLDVAGFKDIKNIQFSDILSTLHTDGVAAVYFVACLIENTGEDPSKKMIKFLSKNLTTTELYYVVSSLILHSRLEDFMSTIILIKQMSLLKTEETIASEKNLSSELYQAQLNTSISDLENALGR